MTQFSMSALNVFVSTCVAQSKPGIHVCPRTLALSHLAASCASIRCKTTCDNCWHSMQPMMQPLAARMLPYLLLRVPGALKELAEVQVRHGIKALCWTCCKAAANAAAGEGHRKQPSTHRCCLMFCSVEPSRFVDVETYNYMRGGLVVSSRWKLLGWV